VNDKVIMSNELEKGMEWSGCRLF